MCVVVYQANFVPLVFVVNSSGASQLALAFIGRKKSHSVEFFSVIVKRSTCISNVLF